MDAICKADFDARETTRKVAEEALENAKKARKKNDGIIVPHNPYHDIYGVWYFSELTNFIRQIATNRFGVSLGAMMHVYVDSEPEKVADGIHQISVYGHNCLLYKWMSHGYHRGLIVLEDDKAGNAAAKIYQDSGTWSWVL